MNLQVTKAALPDNFSNYFESDKCDAFHLPGILDEIYNNNWYSIMISENSNAFYHVFSPNRIGGSDYFDIEPFLGYNGIIVNSKNLDRNFTNRALKLYKDHCYENKIISEIIRFNPILNNHLIYNNCNLFSSIDQVKEIVVANCQNERTLQINEFGKSRRRDIKTAIKSLKCEIKHSPFDVKDFYKLYIDNLDRNNARKEWYFPESFFSNISKNPAFHLFKVVDQDNRIHSSSLFILHQLCSYYFLAANNPPILPGANDLLIFEMCNFAAEMGCEKLILGGGNSSKPDDPLLLYKKKFSSLNHFLYLGKLIHNKEIFESFCHKILVQRPDLTLSNYFLKYRML
jgi:UDP-N-acetylbacillosamine alanyltransferase